jgi:hypothetical protein
MDMNNSASLQRRGIVCVQQAKNPLNLVTTGKYRYFIQICVGARKRRDRHALKCISSIEPMQNGSENDYQIKE